MFLQFGKIILIVLFRFQSLAKINHVLLVVFLRSSNSRIRNSHERYSVKNDIFKNFAKFASLSFQPYFKKRFWYRCFPVKFAKFLRTPFLMNNSGDCFWRMFHSTGNLKDFAKLLGKQIHVSKWIFQNVSENLFPKHLWVTISLFTLPKDITPAS